MINKINILLFCFIILIGVLITILSINRINKEYNWFEGNLALISYLETILMYYKLVVINLVCYIWGNAFTIEFDSYHLLITGYKNIKTKYVLSKVLVLSIITFTIVFINFYLMSLISGLCCKLIVFSKIFIELFIKVLLICVIYGLLSAFFTIIINNNYACFLASGFFVLCELISDNFDTIKLFYVFFPGLSQNYELCFGLFHLLLISIIYVFLVVLSFVYKK